MDQTRKIEEAQENQTRINIWLAISGNYDYYAAAFYVLRTELYSMPYLCTPIEDAPNDRGGLLRVFSTVRVNIMVGHSWSSHVYYECPGSTRK